MNNSPSKEIVFAKALSKILKPLVRLLIRQNITYTGLLNLVKSIYIEVAEESFQISGKRLTDSRVSLLTGVSRGDVKRIRNEHLTQPTEKEIKASLSAQMMSVWAGHQAYLNASGEPIPLYRNALDGSPSFEELVFSISKDKHPRSILDEWLDQGLIKIEEKQNKEFVILLEKGYIPKEDFEEKFFFAGKNIGDHLSIVTHNLENKTPPMFDRAVYYNQLTEASIKTIEETSKVKLMITLSEINQLANELQTKDKQSNNAVHSMHVGAYFYHKLKGCIK
ncbi:DUF6502 family protein [Thiomicrorhabdus arctica]|uniref:DUF6502 family protein n=1 Tax=Thiomicrorhabdus arctica TaxID=131540 RepID=UPI00035E0B96|nr:DUF6502 family protein [Thiomicrorhabdus arctica]